MLQARVSNHARNAVPTPRQQSRAFTDLGLKQHIIVKPGTPIQPIINATMIGQSIYLMPGEHPIYEPLVLRGDGAALFGQRGATILRKLRVFTEPMLSISLNTASGSITHRCTISGLTLTCKYGTGRQIEVNGRDHTVAGVICAAEAGVRMAAGIWCNSSTTLLFDCFVYTDVVTPMPRTEAEIWLPDAVDRCRLIGNCAVSVGSVISYRGIDGTVASGNIPPPTVR